MRFPTYPLLIVTILVFLMVLPGARVYAADIRAADETFNLIDAEQKGTFTIGEASGILSGTRNRAMQFEYTVSPGTYAGCGSADSALLSMKIHRMSPRSGFPPVQPIRILMWLSN